MSRSTRACEPPNRARFAVCVLQPLRQLLARVHSMGEYGTSLLRGQSPLRAALRFAFIVNKSSDVAARARVPARRLSRTLYYCTAEGDAR